MQDKFAAVVAIKNLPVPDVSLCHTTKGLRVESFINSSAANRILTVVDAAVTEGKYCVIHMDNSAVLTAEEGCHIKR